MEMKTISIHGKQYVEVNERIKYFRENFKGWSLTSEVIDLTEKRCVMKASILNQDDRVIATGTAYEMLGSSFINKTSFVENCETSAWGRALANLGIGLDTSIASADEVLNAKKQQEVKPKKEKLNDDKYQAMIVAIGAGKTDVVEKKMKNYIITKAKEKNLLRLINEQAINEAGRDEIEGKKMSNVNDIIQTLGDTMIEYNDLQ
tara:strand:- start:20289 stop:20900 length:612 start_codon:yes stop_codon:yes gene_type:complete